MTGGHSGVKALAALLAAVALTSCSTLGYYAQAIQGHYNVVRQARSIERLIADPATDPALRRRLTTVQQVREFASRELDLPNNGSYRFYADLGRPYVVWNVFAANEFSVEPKQWCMVVVGCVGYRGYYDPQDAERLAASLRAEGLDVYVGGVPAYSTLGYFDDPVLNTFLRYGELEVARLIFHELAHQVLFVSDDTVFNESFATAVENEGMRRWLLAHGTPEQLAGHSIMRQRKQEFAGLVHAYRERLRALYAQRLSSAETRQRKSQTLTAMRAEYAQLKLRWGGYAGYDNWFDRDLNNAQLASVSLYTQLLPVFEALLEEEGHSLRRFYARVSKLAAAPREQRAAALGIVAAGMPADYGGGAR